MNSKTRITLLQRLRNGSDHLSWEDFFARYWPLIYRSAKFHGCSDNTAEEVVQDVMLVVFQQKDVFQYDPARGRFRDWLGTVVKNKVAHYRRRPAERERSVGSEGDNALNQIPSEAPPPDAAWEAAYEEALLTVLLDTVRREMNPKTYLAFELCALGELSGKQVSEITGMSRNAVYKSHRRVLKRLTELGASYRSNGQVNQHIKEALVSRPAPEVERTLCERIEKTMQSRYTH
ncbi:MAG: sigma-70 family RNA polymerase sigma factor [Planctomycetes bacterium]|nr:sigma-70 family RNA polymerase sigma factor [Planctomycetota bacterium]